MLVRARGVGASEEQSPHGPPHKKVVKTSINRRAPTTLLKLIQEGERCLKQTGVPHPRQETDLLVSHAVHLTRLQIYLKLGDPVPAEALKKARRFFLKRSERIPIQHITGVQEFWGLEFLVTPDVLIPRPETEIVVEEAIRLANDSAGSGKKIIVDVGTGCGCIAIALAKSLPHTRILATDISAKALKIAKRNARRLGVERRITFLEGDLFGPLKKQERLRAALIVSNPPYVASGDLNTLAPEVKDHEPRIALDGGPDGMEVCRRIIQEAPDYLIPNGALVMEIGWNEAKPLGEWIKRERLPWAIEFKKDLARLDRVAILKKT